jgi:hypothetical protein
MALSGGLSRATFRHALKAVAAALDSEVSSSLSATRDSSGSGDMSPLSETVQVLCGALAPFSRRPAALLPLLSAAFTAPEHELTG